MNMSLRLEDKMMKFFHMILIFSLMILSLEYSYAETCGYTEKEVPLSPLFANSTVIFIKKALIVHGKSKNMQCPSGIGSIKNFILADDDYSRRNLQYDYIDYKIEEVNPKSKLNLIPEKIISVRWPIFIDSGGTIDYLILKDKKGAQYSAATVSLGINKGEEFLKAINGKIKIILDADTKFSK